MRRRRLNRADGSVAASVYYVELDLFVVMKLNRGDAPLPLRQFLEKRYGAE